MRTNTNTILCSLVLLFSCGETKESGREKQDTTSLILSEEPPSPSEEEKVVEKPEYTGYRFRVDSLHIGDSLVRETKDRIIERYAGLSDWYDSLNEDIDWMEKKPSGEFRDAIMKTKEESILPGISKAGLLAESYRERIRESGEAKKELTNLGALLSNDTIGYDFHSIKSSSTPPYRYYLEYQHDIDAVPVEYDMLPSLGEDTVQNCLREMVHLEGDKAQLSVPYYLFGEARPYLYVFLIFHWVRKEGEWFLDGMDIEEDRTQHRWGF